jgi:hypothetical protein
MPSSLDKKGKECGMASKAKGGIFSVQFSLANWVGMVVEACGGGGALVSTSSFIRELVDALDRFFKRINDKWT